MKKIRRLLTHKLASAIGYYPTKKTKINELKTLLAKLYPVIPEKGLVRIGSEGNGGYLIPNNLEGIQACYSPGVSTECGFDLACAELGLQVFMADRSVDAPPVQHDSFHFSKKFIGALTNEDYMTLDSWVDTSAQDINGDLMLQIDIEGAEYEVFLSTSDHLMHRYRIIIAEFHNLERLFSRPSFHICSKVFEKILQTHTCVHIHPNNCTSTRKQSGVEIPPVCEFTFLRKDHVGESTPANHFPNPLDYDCAKGKPITLPLCWYSN
tara:strand:+ start:4576 stop:5373 length:798 start_codon:yes stop_codon:yes gene_type:complete